MLLCLIYLLFIFEDSIFANELRLVIYLTFEGSLNSSNGKGKKGSSEKRNGKRKRSRNADDSRSEDDWSDEEDEREQRSAKKRKRNEKIPAKRSGSQSTGVGYEPSIEDSYHRYNESGNEFSLPFYGPYPPLLSHVPALPTSRPPHIDQSTNIPVAMSSPFGAASSLRVNTEEQSENRAGKGNSTSGAKGWSDRLISARSKEVAAIMKIPNMWTQKKKDAFYHTLFYAGFPVNEVCTNHCLLALAERAS